MPGASWELNPSMSLSRTTVLIREFSLANPHSGTPFRGKVFTGPGRSVVEQLAQDTGQSEGVILETIVKQLLVKKGADWTSPILSEYLGLYEDSLATFALVWDLQGRQLVAHGAMFQSIANPTAGLVAHIRTLDSARGLGLGTLVTEEVTRAAFARGAQIVTLATDDKRHRLKQGEKAAHSLYSRLGYTILAEKELADTVDWLMAIDSPSLECGQAVRQANDGRFPDESPQHLRELQQRLVAETRARFTSKLGNERILALGDGDLANLFLLLNVSPPDDFLLKLSSWSVHHGPEFERAYVVAGRPAIVDRDRLEDASLTLLDAHGIVVAVCAARQAAPFTRHAISIDFYCVPLFLKNNQSAVKNLVTATLTRIQQSSNRPRPCRVLFSGVDADKIAVFRDMGFTRTPNSYSYLTPDGKLAFEAAEYKKRLD